MITRSRPLVPSAILLVVSLSLGGCHGVVLDRSNKSATGKKSQTVEAVNPQQKLEVDPIASAASQGPFAGITIIELKDANGAAEINPWGRPGSGGTESRYLVIYVSPEGSYASLTDLAQTNCFSWLTEAKTPNSLTFAVNTGGLKDPSLRICRPFTLHMETSSTVRVESGIYDRTRRIVNRIPLVIPEWNLEPIRNSDLNGIRLGPLDSAIKPAASEGKPKISVASGKEILKQFQAQFPSKPGQRHGEVVHGYVVERDHTNWLSDVLLQVWYQESFDRPATVEAFEAAVTDRYGQPSSKSIAIKASNDLLLQWFYDLSGRQLDAKQADISNCLSVAQAFKDESRDFPEFFYRGADGKGTDIGPWGCSLVMTLSRPLSAQSLGVRTYRMDAVHGLALGISHFRSRLGQVRQAQEKLNRIRRS
jgi:hypothetical protein